MAAILQIQLSEDGGTNKLVKQIIDTRNRKMVLQSDFVDGFVVHTKGP